MHLNAEHQTETTNNSLLIGFLSGAALGAAIALMFAPRPGTELRQQLADSAGRLKESAGKLKESAGKFKQKASEASNKVSEGFNEMIRSGREAYERTTTPAAPPSAPPAAQHFDV
jgi:gas vesicle protein